MGLFLEKKFEKAEENIYDLLMALLNTQNYSKISRIYLKKMCISNKNLEKNTIPTIL